MNDQSPVKHVEQVNVARVVLHNKVLLHRQRSAIMVLIILGMQSQPSNKRHDFKNRHEACKVLLRTHQAHPNPEDVRPT